MTSAVTRFVRRALRRIGLVRAARPLTREEASRQARREVLAAWPATMDGER